MSVVSDYFILAVIDHFPTQAPAGARTSNLQSTARLPSSTLHTVRLRYFGRRLFFELTWNLLDLTVLPGNAPDFLSAPTATTPAFIAVSIAFTFLFFLLFSFTAFRTKMGKAGAFFDKPIVQRSTAWIGIFGFMIGQLFLSFQSTRLTWGLQTE